MARYDFQKRHKETKEKAREIYKKIKRISLKTQDLQHGTFSCKDPRGLKGYLETW